MPTAVLKKRSPDGSLTVYLSRRELVLPAEEEGNVVRPLDGVALLGRTLETGERVFALLVLTFRYGREDEEVMGLKFYTEAVLHYQQVVPSNGENKRLTLLQQHLIRKLGPGAHPLTVSASGHLPHSVALRPARMYGGSPLGVTYDLKVFIGMRPDERPSKRELVRMGLRCLHRSLPPQPNPPHSELSRAFLLSSGRIRLEARLDREAYRRTEPVRVHVSLDNSSNRTVHRLSVRIVQHVHVCMFTSGRFKNQVALAEAERPVRPGACLSRVFQMSVQQEQQMRYVG
ncbi:arrestin, lateral eye-like [Uloborus diversus]|uniref:arrestin, lateral eye-like n=1 Tax=Uloborus diversus TaxID=327109 RepID=UPI0024097F1D|nr:arrestin, lateral eye-like [Uloborus diversus]